MTLFIQGRAEGRIILLQSVWIEAQVEIVSVEGPQRMVQPVVGSDPELHTLVLGDGKALEHAHVPIEVSGSVNGRQDGRAVLADLGRHGEAIPVDPLMRS